MMNRSRLTACVFRPLLALSLVIAVSSCAHWRQQWVGPEETIARQHPNRVQVTGKNGEEFVLDNPVVAQDSLLGTVDGQHRAIALQNIDHLSLRRARSLPAILIPLGVIVGPGILFAATWD